VRQRTDTPGRNCGTVRMKLSPVPERSDRERLMNKDTIEGNWKEFKGKIREKWGKLTDDRLDVIEGKRDQLAGEIQQAYGISKEQAEKQVKEFEELTTK
jgi:uncharacterized protein YjbJ (UPF0337 family)